MRLPLDFVNEGFWWEVLPAGRPSWRQPRSRNSHWVSPFLHLKVKVKEEDLYSAFIEVPYTQGAQVRITQCYLQTTPYQPLSQGLLSLYLPGAGCAQ